MTQQVPTNWRPTRTETEQTNSAKLLRNLTAAHKKQQARSTAYETRAKATP